MYAKVACMVHQLFCTYSMYMCVIETRNKCCAANYSWEQYSPREYCLGDLICLHWYNYPVHCYNSCITSLNIPMLPSCASCGRANCKMQYNMYVAQKGVEKHRLLCLLKFYNKYEQWLLNLKSDLSIKPRKVLHVRSCSRKVLQKHTQVLNNFLILWKKLRNSKSHI